MSTYFSAIAIFLLVLSPLFVPVAVTVAASGVLGRPSHGSRLRPLPPGAPPRLITNTPSLRGHAMPIEFTTLQRETLTAIVDTFVASVPREDDPDGFYAAKGSDVGADVATEQYLLTRLPEEQLAGLLQLIDGAGLFEFKDQPQAAREEILANLAAISPEAAGAIAALNQLSVLFAYSLPGPGWPQPAVGRHGVSGPGPESAFGLPQDAGGHHRLR